MTEINSDSTLLNESDSIFKIESQDSNINNTVAYLNDKEIQTEESSTELDPDQLEANNLIENSKGNVLVTGKSFLLKYLINYAKKKSTPISAERSCSNKY